MTVIKVSLEMQRQVFELHSKKYSSRKIAKVLNISRNTVRKIIERGNIIIPGAQDPEWSKKIDWEKIRLEASRGVQMNILAREHAGEVISYVQFWRQFHKKYPDIPEATMRLEHKPGEKSFFDYAEGIDIINRDTGEMTTTHLFCGVMAMSSMTYGEFTLTQKRTDLLRSLERAFRFYGGVTPYVTVDNQRAAVNRAHIYDPEVNETFVDFANHWGFAVIPARPYKPRDKGANESGIGVIQKQFFQEVRERNFYSLEELNQCFRIYLEKLNSGKMKDWGVSREERFSGEKHLLKPCPINNWEESEWRRAKVHADCHVQVLKKFYSVPYQNVGREVRVRVSTKLVEVFDDNLSVLAAHARLLGRETHSTEPRHYPEEKLALTQFSVRIARQESQRVGPETERLVSELLSGSYPLRYLRRVQGILRLHQSGRVTKQALEHACKMGLAFRKHQFPYIQATAEYFDKSGNRPRSVAAAPVRELSSIFLHNINEEEIK